MLKKIFMRKYKIILLFFIITSFIYSASAQDTRFIDKEITLHNYSFGLDDEFQLYIQDIIENNLDETEYWTQEEPINSLFMDKTYNRIEISLEEYLNVNILPKEALEGKVIYDTRGYPCGNKRKAAQKGTTPYYLKLDVQMTARDMITDELEINEVNYKKKKIKAHVVINATLYDKEGKVALKLKGKAKGDRWIVLDRVALFGFMNLEGQDIIDEQATLLSVLDEAIDDLQKQ